MTRKALLDLVVSIVSLLAGLSLGVAGVLVAIAANRISEAQLDLARRQTAVVELELQPRIRFEFHKGAEPQSGREVVSVFNDGVAIDSFYVEQMAFVEVDEQRSDRWQTVLVPVYYYGDRSYSGSRDDLLAELSSYWGPPFFSQMVDAADAKDDLLAALQDWRPHAVVKVRKYLTIGYVDPLLERRLSVWELNPDSANAGLWGPELPRRLKDDEAQRLQDVFNGGAPPQPLILLTINEIKDGWDSFPRL